MIDVYKKELEALKEKMVKAEAFSKKVPVFAEKILNEKITGEEKWLIYTRHYKVLNIYNGVCRGFFKSGTTRSIKNLNDDHGGYYWGIYINTLQEYNSHANYGLEEICKDMPIFFFDSLNTTFYCTDEQIEALLETLNEWKIKAVDQHKKSSIDENIRNLEMDRKGIEQKIKQLKDEAKK